MGFGKPKSKKENAPDEGEQSSPGRGTNYQGKPNPPIGSLFNSKIDTACPLLSSPRPSVTDDLVEDYRRLQIIVRLITALNTSVYAA